MRTRLNNKGFTIAEMLISIVIFSIVAISVIGLFTALVKSAVITKRKAVASTLATNQMEYLKSLPYNNLAVVGGSFYSANPLPATTTQTIDNVTYTIKTSISYIDDAYDGCWGSYPTLQEKQTLCRNYPPPASAPASDTNPADYKIVDVAVSARGLLASVDTQISARVAETDSTTGAMFVTVIDNSGNPISGANVNVVNSTLVPALNLNDSTDGNGVAIFYNLPPDTSGNHYVITASLTNYSSLSTIAPPGALGCTPPQSLIPNWSNQNIITQQSASITLPIKQMSPDSLVIETTDTSGNPISGVKVYAKGGYKKYKASCDTSYYYDNMSPDSRPTTDGSGLIAISNLVPGSYIFCGDIGASNCIKPGSPNITYYLAAAVPYANPDSSTAFLINVPAYDPANPPGTTFTYGTNTSYLQKVRLILTTDANFPRVSSLIPSSVSLTDGTINNFPFSIDGQNLSGANVKLTQGSNDFTASCTSSATHMDCHVDLSSASVGNTQLVVSVSGKTLTLPATPANGGINVGP